MSIKQIGPKKFYVRIQFRDPKTGKKRTLRDTVATEKAAKRRESELRVEARTAGEKRPRLKLAAYATSWLERRLGALKPSVAERYASALDLHILPALGDRFIDTLAPSDVQKYVTDRMSEPVIKRPPSEPKADARPRRKSKALAKAPKITSGATVLNELRCLRTIAKDSVAEGLAARDWAARVNAPPVSHYTDEEPNLLTGDQLGRLLGAIPAYWRPLVALISFTGLRWGEASALRWEDVDRARFEIRIRKSNYKGRLVDVKTDKSRRNVPLPPIAAAFLGKAGKGIMFPTKKGRLHRGSPLRKVLARACKEIEVSSRLTTHGLRRTYNDLCRRVASREVVKSITGHATDSMLEHYSRVNHEEKALATKKVLELIGLHEEEVDVLDPDSNEPEPEPEPT